MTPNNKIIQGTMLENSIGLERFELEKMREREGLFRHHVEHNDPFGINDHIVVIIKKTLSMQINCNWEHIEIKEEEAMTKSIE